MYIVLSRLAICYAASLLVLAQAQAQSSSGSLIAAVSPQPLANALQVWAEKTGWQLMYDPEVVADQKSGDSHEDLKPIEALTKILDGTGLSYRFVNDRTISILPKTALSVSSSEATFSKARMDDGQRALRVAGAADTSASIDSGDEKENRGVDLTEVLVTATKREERLKDVPMNIAVIGTQDIERRGLIGMQDYMRSMPGVSQIDLGNGQNALVIRGITTNNLNSQNFESGATVATYFGETPITGAAGIAAGGGIDVRPVDIERIEVLRGPQGTSFGNASLGGALRILPAKPRLDGFSAKISALLADTGGNGDDSSMLQGVVNVPIVQDKFALRAVGYRYDDSGFVRNIAGIDPGAIARAESVGLNDYGRGFIQNDAGGAVSTGGRLAALWKLTDALDVSLNYLTQKIEQDGTALSLVGQYEQAMLPIAPQSRRHGKLGEFTDSNLDLVNVVLNYDLGWAALTSSGSWIDSGSALAFDLWYYPFPASAVSGSDFRSFTAETRLASQLAGRTQFLIGIYYEKVDESVLTTIEWPGSPETSLVGTNPMFSDGLTRDLDQRAIFSEVSYKLTDKFTASVGGRYFDYEKNEKQLTEGGFVNIPIGGGVRSTLDSSEGDSNFKANLKYEASANSLVYVSWAEGFRLGRPQAGLPSTTCDTNNDGLLDETGVPIESTRRIDSDFLNNYELGTKFSSSDRRLFVSAAAYHIKWDGLPIGKRLTCAVQGYQVNAGAATSDGVELQVSLAATKNLRIDVGSGYTKAELSEDSPGLGEKGDRLPGSPKFNANISAQYDFDVLGRSAFIRADSFYVGKFYGDLQETPNTLVGDYIKVDARAGVLLNSINIELFVKNLTNEDALTWISYNPTNNPFNGYRMRPRTVGVQIGYSFD